jgi:hypothetical protein
VNQLKALENGAHLVPTGADPVWGVLVDNDPVRLYRSRRSALLAAAAIHNEQAERERYYTRSGRVGPIGGRLAVGRLVCGVLRVEYHCSASETPPWRRQPAAEASTGEGGTP